MAIEVKRDTEDIYAEGPFVLVCRTGWHVEVQCRAYHIPDILHESIHDFLRANHLQPAKEFESALAKTGMLGKARATLKVDFLNQCVREGKLAMDTDGIWKTVSEKANDE